jgi:ribosomal protein S11
MQITLRALFASVTATAVLAGAAGALATSAANSQASPQAFAAAVQKVSDQKAETELRHIEVWVHLAHLDLEGVLHNQEHLQAATDTIQTATDSIQKNAYGTCWAVSSAAQRTTDCGP